MSGSLSNFLDDVEDTVTGAANDVEREVTDVFDDVTGRNPDPPSTTSNSAQVTRLYDTVFDRAPDDAGLDFWTSYLRAGGDLDDVAEVFVASPEFQDRYGDLGSGDFVTLLYRNVLDREPDAVGAAYWTEGLTSGAFDRSDVVVAFSESSEHVAKIGPVADQPLI
jgi:Domain of unknown function (DUF4214)